MLRLERPRLDQPVELLDDLTLGNAVVAGNFQASRALGELRTSL